MGSEQSLESVRNAEEAAEPGGWHLLEEWLTPPGNTPKGSEPQGRKFRRPSPVDWTASGRGLWRGVEDQERHPIDSSVVGTARAKTSRARQRAKAEEGAKKPIASLARPERPLKITPTP
jgi:hypothetical protein